MQGNYVTQMILQLRSNAENPYDLQFINSLRNFSSNPQPSYTYNKKKPLKVGYNKFELFAYKKL